MESNIEEEHTNSAPFMGVTLSASSRIWSENLSKLQQNQAIAISQQHGIPEVIGRVLAARNVEVEDIPNFIEPKFKDFMPDPSTITDMDQVCDRVFKAIVSVKRLVLLVIMTWMVQLQLLYWVGFYDS